MRLFGNSDKVLERLDEILTALEGVRQNEIEQISEPRDQETLNKLNDILATLENQGEEIHAIKDSRENEFEQAIRTWIEENLPEPHIKRFSFEDEKIDVLESLNSFKASLALESAPEELNLGGGVSLDRASEPINNSLETVSGISSEPSLIPLEKTSELSEGDPSTGKLLTTNDEEKDLTNVPGSETPAYGNKEKDQEQFELDKLTFDKKREEYLQWKSWTAILSGKLDDDLLYEYSERIRHCEVTMSKVSKVLSHPMSLKDEPNWMAAEFISDQLSELLKRKGDGIKFKELIPDLGSFNFKAGHESDFFINDQAPTPRAHAYAKGILASVSLTYKRIEKSKSSLIRLLLKSLSLDEIFFLSLQEPEYVDGSEAKSDSWLNANFSLIQRAGEAVRSAQKGYVRYLDENLFKVYNEVRDRLLSYSEEIEKFESEEIQFLESLKSLLHRIQNLLLSFLKDQLSIEETPCKPGDKYEVNKHLPVKEGEPSEVYENDQIKVVESVGFSLVDFAAKEASESHGRGIILKQTGVIVTLNKE